MQHIQVATLFCCFELCNRKWYSITRNQFVFFRFKEKCYTYRWWFCSAALSCVTGKGVASPEYRWWLCSVAFRCVTGKGIASPETSLVSLGSRRGELQGNLVVVEASNSLAKTMVNSFSSTRLFSLGSRRDKRKFGGNHVGKQQLNQNSVQQFFFQRQWRSTFTSQAVLMALFSGLQAL